MKRKIKEAILAFRIEKAYTKERILELYLNQIYLGEGTYGIAAASLEYFDKSIKDLNYSEAALLAAYQKLQVGIIHTNIQRLQNLEEICNSKFS